jgi:hypothetical protein
VANLFDRVKIRRRVEIHRGVNRQSGRRHNVNQEIPAPCTDSNQRFAAAFETTSQGLLGCAMTFPQPGFCTLANPDHAWPKLPVACVLLPA